MFDGTRFRRPFDGNAPATGAEREKRMIYGTELFHVGVGVMCAAAAFGVLSCVIFTVTGRRLKKKLEEEYGKKRHG